jgi:carbamoyl-phosphate synthase large subunit
VVIICSIENFDPMGVHTGDSITVAPAQTLTDKEYQIMRDAAIRIIREIGVDTGGSNVQFAVHPEDGRMVVIEMNPRVSRSSALASKATGFPIARIAAKLAVGYTLDEIQNDITRVTPASFEPTIDYVVVKFPRFAFEKFPQADQTLTTQMKSVGEAMAIGRTFKEALQKSIRSLEIGRMGLMFPPSLKGEDTTPLETRIDRLKDRLKVPAWDRVWTIAEAMRLGVKCEEIHQLSMIDPWFLQQMNELIRFEHLLSSNGTLSAEVLRRAKELGFSDAVIGEMTGLGEKGVRRMRAAHGITPVFKRVDTCASEFEAHTPYLYSTYEEECESEPTDRPKVVILGSGPNRIGQGIEFDYCCVHASFALRDAGYETIMVNCNPETVSTDYDTSDRLYFEPLTEEDVLNIIRVEKPLGVMVQLGGQTPLKLAVPLEREGVRILGTSPDAIDRAEDRERFRELIQKLGLTQPESGIARSGQEALREANRIGFPVLVRPSYVLGGRAMEIVYDANSLGGYMERLLESSAGQPVLPLLIDKYLEDAIEIDVDALSDGTDVVVGGIMEHIEEAGIHSGDSACSLPPFSLDQLTLDEIRAQTHALAREIGVIGLMNIQFAIKSGTIYILEVNPRASRTVPFVSKAIGVPLVQIAAKVMVGQKLKDLGFDAERIPPHVSVKEAVFPFAKFPGVDTLLGPEMKSTGEVMGIGMDFGSAFAKSQAGAGSSVPIGGKAFISVKNRDKSAAVDLARRLLRLGFQVEATRGTMEYLKAQGIPVLLVNKVAEGRPHVVDHIKNKEIALVVNTVGDVKSQRDSFSIRRTALSYGVPYYTTIAGARAALRGIEAMSRGVLQVKSLQEYHGTVGGMSAGARGWNQ